MKGLKAWLYSIAVMLHDALFKFAVHQGLVKCVGYTAGFSQVTGAVVADTTSFTSGQAYGFLRGGASTARHKINEVYMGGEDTASTPTALNLSKTSTISVGALSAGTIAKTSVGDAPANAPAWGNVAATTYPQRSSTLYMLNLSLNTYGGIARWQARYGEEIETLGNTASDGEVVLSTKLGGGKGSGHILFQA